MVSFDAAKGLVSRSVLRNAAGGAVGFFAASTLGDRATGRLLSFVRSNTETQVNDIPELNGVMVAVPVHLIGEYSDMKTYTNPVRNGAMINTGAQLADRISAMVEDGN